MMPDPAEHFAASLVLSDEIQTDQTLAGLPARRGLVLFADCRHQPIQLLMCADIRRIARARLVRRTIQAVKKADISSLCKVIYYTPQDSEFACRRLYHRLCRVFFKDQYNDLVSLPRPCFVKLDRHTILPYFAVTETPTWKKDCDEIFGPFITHKNAAAFAQTLNKAFDLCRNPDSLGNSRYSNCVYLQMKTCTGPCLNPQLPAEYAQAVTEALNAASGGREACLQQKENQMRRAAAALEYETARRLRDQIECLRELEKPEYRRVGPLRKFRWLHIDRLSGTKKIQTFCAFLITAGDVIELEPFTMEQIESFLKNLSCTAIPDCSKDTRQIKEHMGEICLFLYRNRRPGLWLDCTRGSLPDAEKLNDLLSRTFDNPKRS